MNNFISLVVTLSVCPLLMLSAAYRALLPRGGPRLAYGLSMYAMVVSNAYFIYQTLNGVRYNWEVLLALLAGAWIMWSSRSAWVGIADAYSKEPHRASFLRLTIVAFVLVAAVVIHRQLALIENPFNPLPSFRIDSISIDDATPAQVIYTIHLSGQRIRAVRHQSWTYYFYNETTDTTLPPFEVTGGQSDPGPAFSGKFQQRFGPLPCGKYSARFAPTEVDMNGRVIKYAKTRNIVRFEVKGPSCGPKNG